MVIVVLFLPFVAYFDNIRRWIMYTTIKNTATRSKTIEIFLLANYPRRHHLLRHLVIPHPAIMPVVSIREMKLIYGESDLKCMKGGGIF